MAVLVNYDFTNGGTIDESANTITIGSEPVIKGRTGTTTSASTSTVYSLDLLDSGQVSFDNDNTGDDGLLISATAPWYVASDVGTFSPAALPTTATGQYNTVGLAKTLYVDMGSPLTDYLNTTTVIRFKVLTTRAFSLHLGSRHIVDSTNDNSFLGIHIRKASAALGGTTTYGLGRHYNNGGSPSYTNAFSHTWNINNIYKLTLTTKQPGGNNTTPMVLRAKLENETGGTTLFDTNDTSFTGSLVNGYKNLSASASQTRTWCFGAGGYENTTSPQTVRLLTLTVNSIEEPTYSPLFTTVYMRRGYADKPLVHKIPVTLNFPEDFTGLYQLAVTGTPPTGVTVSFDKTHYDAGIDTEAFIILTADSTAATSGSSTIQVGFAAYPNSNQTITIAHKSNTRTTNAIKVLSVGSSTIDYADEYYQAAFGTVFGGTQAYTSTVNKKGRTGSTVADWIANGVRYVWQDINEAVGNDYFDAVGMIPYSNDIIGGRTWAGGIGTDSQVMMRAYLDAGINLYLTEFQYRWAETALGVVQAGSTAGTVTLSGGTFSTGTNYAGKYLACKLNSTDWSIALIQSNSSGVFTLSGPTLDGTPASAVTAYILTPSWNAAFDACASGIADLCVGGANDLSDAHQKAYFYGGWNPQAEKYYSRDNGGNNDWTHMYSVGNQLLAEWIAARVGDQYLDNSAVVNVDDETVDVDTSATITKTVTGYADYNHSYWPTNLITGEWSVEAGAAIDPDTGEFLSDTVGDYTVTFTLDHGNNISGNGTVTVQEADNIAPELTSAVVSGDGNSIVLTFNETDSLPMLPTSSVAGFSVEIDGDPATITSATRTDDLEITLVVVEDIFNTSEVLLSYDTETGNVTDSSSNALADITDFEVNVNAAPSDGSETQPAEITATPVTAMTFAPIPVSYLVNQDESTLKVYAKRPERSLITVTNNSSNALDVTLNAGDFPRATLDSETFTLSGNTTYIITEIDSLRFAQYGGYLEFYFEAAMGTPNARIHAIEL